ncbi:HTH_Tnp_Tc3_2 domain-containing protein [Trichonephila clavipes]|nr:HTH_Tnp_Tc3_2 domain-containing protein [Trichonephila clavipes]
MEDDSFNRSHQSTLRNNPSFFLNLTRISLAVLKLFLTVLSNNVWDIKKTNKWKKQNIARYLTGVYLKFWYGNQLFVKSYEETDEVEKLAYQLNEEAEWTERPIRRLSRVMYGSTCADMQVDVMGECLSSIKHVVDVRSVFLAKEIARRIAVKITPSCCLSEKWRIINLLDDIWMLLPEVESLGSWRKACSVTRTAIRGSVVVVHEKPHPSDDRYIVLQARRNRRQTAGEIARHMTQATGRPDIGVFTVARRLHGGGLFARRPVRRVPLTPAHRRRRSLWCREHRNWRDNEWGRVLFTDEKADSV